MKRPLLFLATLLCTGILQARPVTPEQAVRTADRFWQSAPATRAATTPRWQRILPETGSATRTATNNPAYYIFDNTAGGGFVIVAGDDAVRPVLGYSFENEFPAEGLPENLRAWLDGIREEVNYARNNRLQAESSVTQAWAATRAGTPVVKMETALWNQEAPYNNLCPRSSVGTRTYTGCTATALAIIMHWHQWPERGSGTLAGYHIDMNDITVPEITLGHTYDWSNMKKQYKPGYYLDSETGPVATLMRDCAIMLQSNFGIYSTSAPLERIPDAMVNHMGYDGGIRYVYRYEYTTADWTAMMQGDLDNNCPVLYSGYGENGGGHAFVLDGYTDDNYYSINWGWSGNCNGYYLLTALSPTDQGIGGTSSNYNYNQVAVIGIKKNAGGSMSAELRLKNHTTESSTYSGLTVDGPILTNQPFHLRAGLFYNSGMVSFNGSATLVVTDRDGNFIQRLATWNFTLPPRYGTAPTDNYYTITEPILPGYRLRVYYQNPGSSEWNVVRGNDEDGCIWDLLLDDEYNIEESTKVSFDRKSRQLQLQIKEGVTTTLLDSGGADRTSACRIDGQTISIDTSDLSAGTYRLVLQKRNDRKELRFTVAAR